MLKVEVNKILARIYIGLLSANAVFMKNRVDNSFDHDVYGCL